MSAELTYVLIAMGEVDALIDEYEDKKIPYSRQNVADDLFYKLKARGVRPTLCRAAERIICCK